VAGQKTEDSALNRPEAACTGGKGIAVLDRQRWRIIRRYGKRHQKWKSRKDDGSSIARLEFKKKSNE